MNESARGDNHVDFYLSENSFLNSAQQIYFNVDNSIEKETNATFSEKYHN